MDIKEFTKIILIDVLEAVNESSESTRHEMFLAKPQDNKTVEFDIAVTTESTNGAKVSIKVLELGGDEKNTTISRVKFSVYINSQQTKEEQSEKRQELYQKNGHR